MRIQRFSGITRPTVSKRAPWAQVIVKVDGTYIAFESPADARESGFCRISDLARSFPSGDPWDNLLKKRKSKPKKKLGASDARNGARFLARSDSHPYK